MHLSYSPLGSHCILPLQPRIGRADFTAPPLALKAGSVVFEIPSRSFGEQGGRWPMCFCTREGGGGWGCCCFGWSGEGDGGGGGGESRLCEGGGGGDAATRVCVTVVVGHGRLGMSV